MKSKRKALTLFLVGALGLQSGCGALVFHNPENVVITCNTPGATVEAQGENIAAPAPATLRLDRTRDHILVVQAPGYSRQTVRVDSHPSWWRILISVAANGAHGIFTLFISTAIGLGIDIAAGSWQSLDDDEVFVTLHRQGFDAPSTSGMGEVSALAGADVAEVSSGSPDKLAPGVKSTQATTKFWPWEKDSCPNCGSHVRDEDHFCSNCGERLAH